MRKRQNNATLSTLRAKKMQEVHEGEIRPVNDGNTRGHNSIITKKYRNGKIKYTSTTHSPKTHGVHNYKLVENLDSRKREEKAYLVKKSKETDIINVGKKRQNMFCKNAIDKSVIRHYKNKK